MAKSSSLVSACGSEYVGGSRAGERAERRRPGCCMEICERKYLLLLTYLHTFIVATYRISVKLLELVQGLPQELHCQSADALACSPFH